MARKQDGALQEVVMRSGNKSFPEGDDPGSRGIVGGNTPLLAGTTRERLLSEKKILLKTIKPQNLKDYFGLKLINAMRLPEEEPFIPVDSIW